MNTDNIFGNDILNGDLNTSLVPEIGQEDISLNITPSESSFADPLNQELSLTESEVVIREIDIDDNSVNRNTSSFNNIAVANIDSLVAANPEKFQVNEIDVNDTSFAPPQSQLEFQGGFGDVNGGNDVPLEIKDTDGSVIETFKLTGEGQASLYRDEEYQYVFFSGTDKTTNVDIDSTSNIKFGNYIGDSLKIETSGSIDGGDIILNEPDNTGLVLRAGLQKEGESASGNHTYEIVDIGTLIEGGFSKAKGINDSGQVVGFAKAIGATHSFLYDDNGIKDLGSIDGRSNYAQSINNSGQIVGYDLGSAFLYEKNTMTSLGYVIPKADGGSSAFDINNSGQIVGESYTAYKSPNASFTTAFLRNADGEVTNIGAFADFSQAFGINDLGQVVGFYNSLEGRKAFVHFRDQGTYTIRTGSEDSIAYDINDSTQIVGAATIDSRSRAFLLDAANGFQNIDLLPESNGSKALAINNSGQVVGSINTNSGDRAFFYDGNQIANLNDLIVDSSGWTLTEASDINDNGQIVGTGRLNDNTRAFLLNPILTQSSGSTISVGNISTFGDTVLLQGNEITLTGNAITTQGAEITFDAATTVDRNLTINSSVTKDKVITGGGNITFTKTLDSSIAGSGNLRLQAGTGNILFGDTVGGEAALKNINVLGADIVTTTADITSDQLIKINATGDIITQNITSDNGRVVLSSQEKSISTLDITSGSEEGDHIVLQAGDSVSTKNLSANELGIVRIASGKYKEEDSALFGDITTESITGKRIRVESTGNFTALGDALAQDGNVVIDAKQDIATENITAENGNVRLISEEKSVTSKDITSGSDTEGGNIVLEGVGGVRTDNLNARELGVVRITSGEIVENDTETLEDDTILVGDISTESITGKALRAVGTGSFTATGDITAHDGKITVAVTNDVNTKNINSLAKSINLISIEGAVTVDGDLNSEKGGVAIHAADDINAQKIRSFDGAVALSSYDGEITIEDDINTVRGGVTIAAKEGVEVARITTGVGEVNIGSGKDIVANGNISTNVGYVNLKAGSSLNVGNVTTNDGYISLGADSNVEVSSLATGSGVINLVSATGSVAAGSIDTEGSYVAIEAALEIIGSAIEANGGGIDLVANSDFGGIGLIATDPNTATDINAGVIESLEDLSPEQAGAFSEIISDTLYHTRPVGEFIVGALYATVVNNFEDAFNAGQFLLQYPLALTDRDKRYWTGVINNQSTAFKLGIEVGNAASIVQGIIEIVAGGGTFAGGAALCTVGAGATFGISCAAGAPAMVTGAAVSVHGLSLIKNGIENDTDANLIDDLLAPQKMASTGGSNAARGLAQKIGASSDKVDNALEVLGSKKIEQLEGRLNFTETRFQRDASGQLVPTEQDVKLLSRVLDKGKELVYNISKSFDVVGNDVDSINDIRGTIRQNRVRPDKPQLINDTELNTALTDHNNFIGKYKDRVSGAYANRFGRARSSELDNIQAQGELNTATDILDGNTALGNDVKMRGLPDKINTQKNPDYLSIMPDGNTRIVEVKTLTGKVTDRKIRINLGKAIDQIDNNISTINPTKNGYVRLDFSNADSITRQPDGWLKKIKKVFDSNTKGFTSIEFVEVFYRNDANQVQKLLIQVKNGVVDLAL